VLDEIPMQELAGAPPPTVPGHAGTIASVAVDDVPVLVLMGRVHLYEGHRPSAVVHAVRAAVHSGCRAVCLTNAAGSLRPEVGVGRPVVISDHLNLTGSNPLCGPEPPGPPGNRFSDLTRLYSPRLRAAALAHDPSVTEGVYAGLLGGSFETPAEIRMLATLGADLVGMSTVLEAIAAHHLGAEVFGASLVTNLAAGLAPEIDHEEVLAAGRAAGTHLADLLRAVLAAT
jgi:purine-nucleoside phosphorylase